MISKKRSDMKSDPTKMLRYEKTAPTNVSAVIFEKFERVGKTNYLLEF